MVLYHQNRLLPAASQQIAHTRVRTRLRRKRRLALSWRNAHHFTFSFSQWYLKSIFNTTNHAGRTKAAGPRAVWGRATLRQAPGRFSPVRPRQKTEHFPCSPVIAPTSAPVPPFHHAAKTLLDLGRPLSGVERMRGRPQAARHRFWKMDFRQVAQRHRTEAARPESARAVCRHPTQGIHHRNSARTDRPPVRSPARLSRKRCPAHGNCQRPALAMATRRLAARRPHHRTSLPTQPARVRSLLFNRELVSRLHRLLRRLRRRQEALRGRSPGGTPQAHPEKRCRRTRRSRRSRLRMPAPSLGTRPHASNLPTRRRPDAGVQHPKPSGRRSQRRRRTRGVAAQVFNSSPTDVYACTRMAADLFAGRSLLQRAIRSTPSIAASISVSVLNAPIENRTLPWSATVLSCWCTSGAQCNPVRVATLWSTSSMVPTSPASSPSTFILTVERWFFRLPQQ